jgi:hypothetical protein
MEYLPTSPGVFDPLADDTEALSADGLATPSVRLSGAKQKPPREPMLRFYSLEQLAAYE